MPEAIGIRVTYDPNLHLIRTYYDLDTDQSDGDWTLFQAFTMDGSAVPGAATLDWGMTDTDVFSLGIDGYSEGAAIAPGSAWADDFAFTPEATIQSELGIRFVDDFNDDSRHPLWSDPVVETGTPALVEASHRLELRVNSASGEQEVGQLVSSAFWPRYDQGFEVELEAHCLPGAMTFQDQVAIADLLIANDSGEGDLLLSVAVIFDQGARRQALVADNSEVEPQSDWPESIDFLALPEVVGLRVVWAPDTKVMSCYVDTDGDRTVETWILYADYTLDGSSQGTAHAADWRMSPSDRFRIGVNGAAEGTIITPGEVYFENFALVNTPLAPTLTGFELWASAIPDAGKRGPAADASGNGIANLAQYLYGLTPLATDTDVELTIRMESGVPVLIHGVNEFAEDYTFGYQGKTSLSDPWVWMSDEVAPSMETSEADDKMFRRITLPLTPSNRFIQLGIVPQP